MMDGGPFAMSGVSTNRKPVAGVASNPFSPQSGIPGDASLVRKNSQLDGLYRLYRTDKGLKPAEISALLGVEIKVKQRPIYEEKPKPVEPISTKVNFVILLVALACATIGIIFTMHQNEIGPFHQSGYLSSH